MAVVDELLESNQGYADGFGGGGLAMPPARHVAIVTCMDARVHPEQALGIALGDAHVIRNAGGRAEDAIRSLVISQRLLGTTEIVVMHHTDCGMLTFSNADLAAKIKGDLGVDTGDRDFLPFADLEQSVRDDLAALRGSELVPNDIPIAGLIYDVNTGVASEVARV